MSVNLSFLWIMSDCLYSIQMHSKKRISDYEIIKEKLKKLIIIFNLSQVLERS